MVQIPIHEAETQFAALVDRAARGETFVIAKAGKPLVKVIPFAESSEPKRRTGFLKGRIRVPADFDDMFQAETAELFNCAGKGAEG